MRKWIIAAIILVVLAVAGFYAMRMMSPPPADLDVAREKMSAAGTYEVTIEPEAEPIQQGALHGWIVTVKTPDGEPVSDAEITVDGGMPQHGHGLPTAPQSVGHLGEGRYRIEGVRFNMGGWWVLKFAISAPAGNDEAEFNIVL
ncbi:MAG: FixH family protein [Neoaquamicrobium sediminum]|jgi:hypothetical protein|uniref:FixH family protein n=1 Tax=Neoaquamicrobium sediminum TaxID=1849104 RepID=UPI00403513D2